MRGSRPLIAAVFFLANMGRSARAEPASTDIAVARQAFAEARAAEKIGEWAKAVSKLHEAIQVKDTASLRFHLAYCEEKLGHLVDAMLDYDRAEEQANAAPQANQEIQDVARETRLKREALRARVPTLTLSIDREVSSPSLEIDGRPVRAAAFGKPIPLDPGDHSVVVRAPGRSSFEDRLTLKEGDRVVSSVVLPNAAAAGSEPVASVPAMTPGASAEVKDEVRSSASGSSRTVVLVAEAGVTAALLGVGIGFTAASGGERNRAAGERTSLEAITSGASTCAIEPSSNGVVASHCAALETAIHHEQDDRNIATAAFVGAGLGAAAFGLTWLLWPAHSKAESPAIRPLITRETAGLLVTTAF